MTTPRSASRGDQAAPSAGVYRWCVVGMLWLVCLFNYADRQAIFSVFPLLEEEMTLNDVQLGIVGGSFMWIYAAALPLAGLIGDRANRMRLVLGGLVFWSLITLATAWSTKYWHLVTFRALEGFGEAFYYPASMSLISAYHGKETRSRAMALHQTSVYAGTILGGTLAGYCGGRFGWRSGFYVFGILGVALAAVLVLFLRERPRAEVPSKVLATDWSSVGRSIAEVLRQRTVLVLIAVFVGANFVAAIFLSWLPKFLHDKFGMSLVRAGWQATAWSQVASVFGALFAGWLADRWARRFQGGRMATQAIGLFVGAPFIFLTGWTMDENLLVLALIGFGFFKGMYDANIWAALYDVVPAHRRATAQGLMNSIGWLGAGTAPVAIGAASQHFGMGACLSVTSVIYIVFGTVMIAGLATLPRQDTPKPGAGRR